MKIIKCKKVDFEIWSEVRAQLWPIQNPKEHLRELEIITKLMTYVGWVAFSNEDKPLGLVEASLRPFANGCKDSPTVFLEGIWVNPGSQIQGTGSKLLKEVEAWAKKNHIYEMGSDVDLSNIKSQRIHNFWGFKETQKVIYYRREINRQ